MSQRLTEHLDKQKLNKNLSNNLVASVFARIYQVVTRVFIPPIVLIYIPMEEYGIWALCFTLISYLGLGAFGISGVYVRYVAEYHASNQIEKINGLLSTGIVLVSSILVILLLGFWLLVPWLVNSWFTIRPELQHTASILFMGTAFIFLLQLSIGSFNYVLEGLQKVVHVQIINSVCLTVETILIIVLLFLDFKVYALLYAFIARYVLSIIGFWIVSYQIIPGLSVGFKHVSRDYLPIFYHYGGILQIGGILGIFIHSFARLFAGTIDTRAAGLLDVSMKFPVMSATISDSMNNAYLPTASYLHAQQRKQEILKLYIEGCRHIGLLTGYFMGFMAAFAYPLMVAMLPSNSDDYSQAAIILGLYTVAQQLHVMTGPGTAFFRAIEQPKRSLMYPLVHISLLLLTYLTAYLLYNNMNLTILAIVATTSMGLSALLYNSYINYIIDVKLTAYLGRILIPSLMPYAVGFATLAIYFEWFGYNLSNRWDGVYMVFFGGVIYTVLIGFLMYFIILSYEEKRGMRSKILKIFVLILGKINRANRV